MTHANSKRVTSSRSILVLAFLLFPATAVANSPLLEPKLMLNASPSQASPPRIALTFDACDGSVDKRILGALIDHAIPATIFVTGKWLKRNRAEFELILSHRELFEIGDHGDRHVPAVDEPVKVYGIAAAGSPQAVADEITKGTDDIISAGGSKPKWFRGATARYTASSITLAESLGYRIAGYSLNGDDGASLSEKGARKRLESARDGDVVIAHINHPTKPAGAGVVEGILALKAKGFQFVKLSAVHD